MAQKLYCSQDRYLGQGRASQPEVAAGAALMAPEAEDEVQEAEADHALFLKSNLHVSHR